jgi:hypothetical protein
MCVDKHSSTMITKERLYQTNKTICAMCSKPPKSPRPTSGLCANHQDMSSRTSRISNATAAAARLLLVLPLLLAAVLLLLLVLLVLCMLVLPLMLVCCRQRLNNTCRHARVEACV